MNKQDFLEQLRKGFYGLPQDEIDERLIFYREMIEDRMEEGLSEENAVSTIGSVSEIVAQITADIPLTKIAKERIKPKSRLKVWEIILLILGSPVWLSLVIAAIAVILSLYISLWSVIVSIWSVFATLISVAFATSVAGVLFICSGNFLSGIATVSTGIVCSGLSVFIFYGCKAATEGILLLTKKLAIWIKNCVIRKETTE